MPRTFRQRCCRGPCWPSRGVAILVFLVLPIFIVVPMSFSASRFLAFPPPALVAALVRRVLRQRRVDAGDAGELADAQRRPACSPRRSGSRRPTPSTRRRRASPRSPIRLLMVPLMMPHIVVAVGVFFLFARIGLNNTLTGLILAHTMLAIPFVAHHHAVGPAGLRYEPGACCPEPWRQSADRRSSR